MFRRNDLIPSSLLESDLATAIGLKELRQVERRGTSIHFASGRIAMREGEVGRECMVVVDGSFAVERNGRGVSVLRPGMVMGEVALLTMEPRNATVTAMEESVVYAFNRREFVSLMNECPAFAALVHADAEVRTPAG
jgi:CRP-like cAMP-binding protein